VSADGGAAVFAGEDVTVNCVSEHVVARAAWMVVVLGYDCLTIIVQLEAGTDVFKAGAIVRRSVQLQDENRVVVCTT